ncbi:Putative glycosyltransferase EpsE [Sporomusa ovata DSM 2662]|uniref:Putative N-acetylgalactosaminyl-diphosphoundecaprenol glucuronosyltransferase n=1 Tax=Sporomusa ovata TaxID=2378 RepID=A0A0U1KUS7_9FIRM|nr:glycosyltransferase [Sporomusa ovata]EQB27118.1 glycosyl transferase [Sporomusa ovata DSM 2662]CQR71220.1 Putative N-acetylgalactosaminyl-diphosphoundecaprenol glucuronosyltransferase [Sporomusa ovata]
MNKYSIVCICQIYNEIEKGNLDRFIHYIKPIVDAVVIYDDGSTDGSYEHMLTVTPYVIRGVKNNFDNRRRHKQRLLTEALKLSPHFILWLDADEVLGANTAENLQNLCQFCIQNDFDGVSLQNINIWRSKTWKRLDSLYDTEWFVRLWRVTPEISFDQRTSALYQQPYPENLRKIVCVTNFKVLHYGFSTIKNLAYRYLRYRSKGQRGYNMLDRLISEETLVLEQVPEQEFPEGLWLDEDPPVAMSFFESLSEVEKYREAVFRPQYSIICLIDKDVEWLKFIYNQVLKYTDLSDKEFYFVTNNATEVVLNYLKDNYIPHYIYNNIPNQPDEWYINNVYRAYNYGARKAKGDFLIFINSYMAFSPNWLENMLKVYNGTNCVTSRLVESGKLTSGLYEIEKNFGYTYNSYNEAEFNKYVAKIIEELHPDSRLYMPLLIRKQHFDLVGGYPEGNIIPGSNIFSPQLAQKGEANISGDKVLIKKLLIHTIKHQTSFDSIVYHFQCGESDSEPTKSFAQPGARIAICNDSVTGSMGEKVLWDFLLDNCPSTIGVDTRIVGENNFSLAAKKYIDSQHPEVSVVLQNATCIDFVDQEKFTIAFLQDDLRQMGKPSLQQERNLKLAHKLVTNSIQTALSYPEYDFEIIPIGVEETLSQWNELFQKVLQDISWQHSRVSNKSKPIVSIIMPTYNQDQFIAQSIQSVIEQTFTDWELIIVNDGSTDNTVDIIRKYNTYCYGKIKIINKEVNQGIALAINDGLRAARGKYFCWLSSDDLFTSNKLEKQVSFLELYSEYGMVFSGYDWIDEKGNYLGTIIEKELEGATLYRTLLVRDCIHGCSIMIRREYLDEVGMFNPDFKYAQDYDMWLRLATNLNIAYLSESLLKGRIHSKAGTNEGKNEIDAIHVIFTFILNNTASTRLFEKAGFDNSIDALTWILERLYDQFCNKNEELMQIKRGIEWILSNRNIPEEVSNFSIMLDKKIECKLNPQINQT